MKNTIKHAIYIYIYIILKVFINFCKVEFIQPSNWLYLVTLYLGGFDVRVVSEIE